MNIEITAGQALVIASIAGALFCTKESGIRRTALAFSALFTFNYLWLKWTAQNIDAGFYGFYVLRVVAEGLVIAALCRNLNRLSKWLIAMEICLVAANLLAMLAAVDGLQFIQSYKKTTVLALESLQIFGIFCCVTPIYQRLVGATTKKDSYTWLARSMTQSHT